MNRNFIKKLAATFTAVTMLSTSAFAAVSIDSTNYDKSTKQLTVNYSGLTNDKQATILIYDVTDATEIITVPNYNDEASTPIQYIDQNGSTGTFTCTLPAGLDPDSVIAIKVGGTGEDTPAAKLLDLNPTASTEPEGVLGDLTGDNLVDNRDVVAAVQIWKGVYPTQPVPDADINEDKLVDNRDVVAVVQIWKGVYNPNPSTTEPTVEPTVAPTVEPTVAPTVAPTVEPTVVPSTEPTVAPETEVLAKADFNGESPVNPFDVEVGSFVTRDLATFDRVYSIKADSDNPTLSKATWNFASLVQNDTLSNGVYELSYEFMIDADDKYNGPECGGYLETFLNGAIGKNMMKAKIGSDGFVAESSDGGAVDAGNVQMYPTKPTTMKSFNAEKGKWYTMRYVIDFTDLDVVPDSTNYTASAIPSIAYYVYDENGNEVASYTGIRSYDPGTDTGLGSFVINPRVGTLVANGYVNIYFDNITLSKQIAK